MANIVKRKDKDLTLTLWYVTLGLSAISMLISLYSLSQYKARNGNQNS